MPCKSGHTYIRSQLRRKPHSSKRHRVSGHCKKGSRKRSHSRSHHHRVKGYRRSDGVHVKGHLRKSPKRH